MICELRRMVDEVKIRCGVLDRREIDARLAAVERELPGSTWRHRAELLDERDFLETSRRILDQGRKPWGAGTGRTSR